MPSPLEALKQAQHHYSTFREALPDFGATLDHHLLERFPNLPASSCTDDFFVTYEADQEPGQLPRLISHSLTELIKQGYSSVQLPTYVQGSTHVYNYAYSLAEADRTSGISIVQVEEFIREVITNLERVVISATTHFWATPLPALEGMAPTPWLHRFIQQWVGRETELRYADSTLSETACAALQQVLRHESYQKRLHSDVDKPLAAYSIALKGEIAALDIPLNGVLVIADNTASCLGDAMHRFKQAVALTATEDPATVQARKVVLFQPGSGLEEFDSLHAMSLELLARFADIDQREALLDHIQAKDRTRALTLHELGYREIMGDAWAACADGMIGTFVPNIQHAWAKARADNTEYALEALAEHLEKAFNASLSLNPANILQTRYTRWFESQLPQWLKQAPESGKQQWRQAVARLTHEHQVSQTQDTPGIFTQGQKSSVLAYARHQLRQRIKADHNLEVDPDTLIITTTEALNTGPGFYPLNPTGSIAGASLHRTGPSTTYHTTRRSLSELALENVGKLDLTFALTARVLDTAGKTHPVLSSAYIKALVRELDVGTHYLALITQTLIHDPQNGSPSPQAQWRKERYVAVASAQLHLNLIEARLNDTPAYALTHQEADWIERLLTPAPAQDQAGTQTLPPKANALILNGHAVPGLWVLTPPDAARKICYTPYAPDSIWFRTADSLEDLARQLSAQPLREYLLQRITPAQQPYIVPLLNTGLGPRDIQLFALNTPFLEAAYDIEAQFAIRNADEQSTSTYESNVQTAKDITWALVDVISFVLPFRVLLPLVLARFLYSVSEGFDALRRDEQHEALLHFMGSIAHLTDGASDFAGSAVFAQAIRQRSFYTPRLNPKTVITRTTAERLTLRTGEHYGSGIHELRDPASGQLQYFLTDANGQLRRCRYDALNETWRLLDERQPDLVYHMPARELSSGRWDAAPSTHARQRPLTVQQLVDRYVVHVDLSQLTPDRRNLYKVVHEPLSPQGKQVVHHYIEQSGIVFEVKSDWLGRHWYLYNANSHTGNALIYKVRRHAETGYWEVKNRHLDHTKLWEPLMVNPRQLLPESPASRYCDYLASPEHLIALEKITAGTSIDFNRYSFRAADMESARLHLHRIQQRMFEDAQAFLKRFVAVQRPPFPELSRQASLETVFTQLHERFDGVVIGESHFALSSKKVIKDTLAIQARNKVKTLYMEHLQAELHQAHLDTFYDTGTLPSSLENFLIRLDDGYNIDPANLNSFTSLVLATRRHGIRVVALDCIASYHPKGIDTGYPNTARHQLLSHGANQIISRHQAQAGAHKWIALTGNTHSNTFQGIPGLAELENAIGLRVMDVAPGTSQGLGRDPGIICAPSIHSDISLLKSDFLLEVDIPGTAPKVPGVSESRLNERLTSRGHFTFDLDVHRQPELIHRASDRQIVRTPLHTNAQGLIFIERPNWTNIHEKPFPTLSELIQALQANHMAYIKS